jgi:hypothetical protein
MEDKAIEFLMSYIPNSTDDKIIDECVKAMLEFGHYVAEEQKKQCANKARVHYWQSMDYKKGKIDKDVTVDKDSILNSKNVCEQ